jgi:class 3 adenylate cyclase
MFTFRVTNGEAMLQGTGDLHDRSFDSLLIETTYQDFNELVLESNTQAQDNSTFQTACSYRIRVYPTNEFQSMYLTNKPIIYTVIVVLAFGVTTVVFLAYDYIVRRLQTKVLDSAKQSELIVSSLFPKLVRERLFLKATSQPSSPFRFGLPRLGKQGITFDNHLVSHKTRLKTYLTHPPSMDMVTGSEPIADLYPNTTVLFADIAGFTAWSSEREPSQVFRLLECLYSEFDAVARELGVFKVETIGDCYVAVTGLPEKMKYHAVIMVEFAYKCFVRMHEMLSKLESVLGPGTADLSMRIGLHSGPVTAGVLRGERARFQLFGDTVNVASRMESTGQPDKVHISQETADLLIKAGKESWVTQRGDSVLVKGKGLLQTYWANPLVTSAATNMDERTSTVSSESFGASSVRPNGTDTIDSGEWGESSLENALALKFSPSHGRDRLVEWFVELLQGLLQKIVAMRVTNGKLRSASKVPTLTTVSESAASYSESENTQFVYEITEVIEMPDFGKKNTGDSFFVDMGPVVRSQLRDYVALIASMYRDIAFHNFEHACHVAMSASKLLKRVLVPEDVNYKVESSNRLKSHKVVSKEVHDTTFGISSDPLMQFAVVFSALIHDVDHNGVTNKQLILENDPVAIKYHGKCVAEQRSIQVAWDFLMQDKYTKLRNCIYQTEAERRRFRQLLVNAVIATDIADKELSSWRKNRWDKVFHVDHPQVTYESERNRRDRKATIVFEYIIQASDVAHTMQHWHIYQKWNKRLFDERYTAYLDGREAEDPSTGWHKGEVGFFDNYVIPLARKLEECKVFGVSCDEYLSYALQNRHEWEMKGEDAVKEMVANYHHCNDDHDDTTTAPAMTV